MNKIIILLIMLVSGCAIDIEINPGEIEGIPFTPNYAVCTDSTIVIVDRQSGKTVNIINRSSKAINKVNTK